MSRSPWNFDSGTLRELRRAHSIIDPQGLADSTRRKLGIRRLTHTVTTGVNKLKLKPSARKSLEQRRKLHIKVRFTFTPAGGTANSKVRAFTVKLPKKKH